MTRRTYSGLFIAEGSSDLPLAGIIESLFFARGVSVRLSNPDYSLLSTRVRRDVKSRLTAGLELTGETPNVIVVHRDSDSADPDERRREIEIGAQAASVTSEIVPVIPVRMTEAWLLIDERAIRQVAGNPGGHMDLGLPKLHEIERKADPKKLLGECLIRAADATGRRRKALESRFSNHRRQLLQRLDPNGPVTQLTGWQALEHDIDAVTRRWLSQQQATTVVPH